MKRQFFIDVVGSSFLGLMGAILLFSQESAGQESEPVMAAMLPRADRERLDAQAEVFYKELDKLASTRAESVVYVCRGNKLVAMGTVVGLGQVLTKWSDIAGMNGYLRVCSVQGDFHDTSVLGGSAEHDLVLLSVPTLQARPLDFSQSKEGKEGEFLLTVLPNGQVGDFGVISVSARSLRDEDMPYLGVVADASVLSGGVMVAEVQLNSGAHQAGILAGDKIIKMNGKEVDGPFAMRMALKGCRPGESVLTEWSREGKFYSGEVALGARPRMAQFAPARLEAMNSMGNPMSARRQNFPWVIQSDMTLDPVHAGAPVLGIDGKVMGIALSRAGRTETYILPAPLIAEGIKNGLGQSPSELEKQSKLQSKNVQKLTAAQRREQEDQNRQLQETLNALEDYR